MATLAFDSLRYARRLREAGVPEPQAEVQAELMAEAFGFYADNIVTRDYLDAVLRSGFGGHDQRFDRIDARSETFEDHFDTLEGYFTKFEGRLEALEGRFTKLERRFERLEHSFEELDRRIGNIEHRLEKLEPLRIQATLHSFMLGLIVLVQVVPQLQAWLAP